MRRLITTTLSLIVIFVLAINCKMGDKNGAPAAQKFEQQAPAKVENIDVATFKELEANADSNTVILDVRTPGEYAAGHIENSILIDINSRDFKSKVNELDRDKTYLVYCRTGRRSAAAAQIMTREFGFTDVKNLLGGITSYNR